MAFILTAQQMREADRFAIEEIGIPGLVLMENAARGACDVLGALLGDLDGASIAIVCGKGNNGGDGLAMARHALNAGAEVVVALLAPPDELSRDARTQYDILLASAPDVLVGWDEFLLFGEAYDAVVDAVLGTGAGGDLQGVWAEAVEWMNDQACVRLAMDVPTGVNADTGESGSPAFDATATATMGALKPGLLLGSGADNSGDVYVIDIGAPSESYTHCGLELLDAERAAGGLPRVKRARNKFDRGKVFLAAGALGMTGAAALAAEACVRAGAGLTVLGLPAEAAAAMPHSLAPEVMTRLLSSNAGAFAADAFAGLDTELYAALAIGPGLSRSQTAAEAVRGLVRESTAPVVLDADGLNAFAGEPERLRERTAPLVITPHHGEMARLLGQPRATIDADPLGAARDAAVRMNCIVVLKGAPTVVAAPDGRAWINAAGNPGMATGGAGDVLTGTAAALIAQGEDVLESTLAAVYLHSAAADIAVERTGLHSLAASDIIDALGRAFQSIESDNG